MPRAGLSGLHWLQMNAPMRKGPAARGQVVLVLQGGGALGAYQAGVYEALRGAGSSPTG